MRSLVLFVLLGVSIVNCNVLLRRSRNVEPSEGEKEMESAVESSENGADLHEWLTDEQKEILKPIRSNHQEFKEKVMEFYGKLSPEVKKTWDEKYKIMCDAWLTKVASEEEIAELEVLRKTDKSAAETKRTEYEERLPEEERKMVQLWKDNCVSLTSSRKRRHILTEEEKEWLHWMDGEQRKIIEDMHENDEEEEVIHKKVRAYFHELPEDRQTVLRKEFKEKCTEWITEVASATEQDELRAAYENEEKDVVRTLVNDLFKKLEPAKQKKVQRFRGVCKKLWKLENTRLRRELDANFAEFTVWMSEEQKKEIGELKSAGKDLKEIRDRTMEFFTALPEEKQKTLKEGFKTKCKAYFSKLSSPEELESMKKMYEAGNVADVRSTIDGVISRQEDDIKPVATKMQTICNDVYETPKKRRDVSSAMEKHLSWLSDAQKEEIKEMKTAGKSKEDIRKKLFSFINDMEAEQKEATRKECYKWLDEAATKEEVAELHKLHETDHNACKTKVREYIARLPVETKAEVEKNLPYCEKVWYGDHANHGGHDHAHHHRRRRHLHAIEKYIKWLTPEQMAEVEDLENSGANFEVVIAKIKAFYAAQDDNRREELKTTFKHHCADWVKDVGTEEEIAELKKWKEEGKNEEISAKLDELETRLSEDDKHTVEHVREVCMGVWEVKGASRLRRHGHGADHPHSMGGHSHHHHHHNLEEALTMYLTWTSDDQKQELKDMKEAGEKEAIYKKIMEFFEATEGEEKKKAAEELKGACKHYAKDIFGKDKTAELKTLKDNGATHEDMVKKIDELIEGVTEPEKKEKALKLKAGCTKIYQAVSRKRRDHHHHSLEEALTKYLTWTTDYQKQELKDMKDAGEKEAIYKKIMEFFEATEGEQKKKAAEELKGACKHYAKDIFGEEKTAELKTLKDNGATHEDMVKKIDELIEGVTEPEKKEKALKLKAGCTKIYQAVSRKRREHHHHSLEEALTKYLTWTTDDQKQELKDMKEAGEKEAIYKKIMEFFEATEGEEKKKAAEELKGACKHYAKDIFGEEKTAELKTLKDNGATHEDMVKKIDELIEGVTEPGKKEKALKLKAGCTKVYQAVTMRHRRHTSEVTQHLLFGNKIWLTSSQVAELREIRKSGSTSQFVEKISQFYRDLDDKSRATLRLTATCRTILSGKGGSADTSNLVKLTAQQASSTDLVRELEGIFEKVENREIQEIEPLCIEGYKNVHVPNVNN